MGYLLCGSVTDKYTIEHPHLGTNRDGRGYLGASAGVRAAVHGHVGRNYREKRRHHVVVKVVSGVCLLVHVIGNSPVGLQVAEQPGGGPMPHFILITGPDAANRSITG